MNCPRCNTPLELHQAARLALHGCHGCGGLFLDGEASKRVVSAVDPDALATADQAAREARARVDESGPAACPACARPMQRVEVAEARVLLDACAEHGVWFDRDELQRVMRALAPQRTTPVPMAPTASAAAPVAAAAPAPAAPQTAWDTPAARFFSPTKQPAAPAPAPAPAPAAAPAPATWDTPAAHFFSPTVEPAAALVTQPVAASSGAPAGAAWDTPAARFYTENAATGASAPPGAPAAPGLLGSLQAPGQWTTGQKAVAVGAGVAAVGGLAYAATHTNLGRGLLHAAEGQAFGSGGLPSVGSMLSKLFE